MPDIVYCGNTDFFRIRQRPQHLALGLAKYNRVLYVSPPFSVIDPFLCLVGIRERKAEYSLHSKFTQEAENLFVFTPPLMFPKYADLATGINFKIIAGWVERYLRRIGFVDYVLWLSNPLQIGMAKRFPQCKLVYDIMDKYELFFPRFIRPFVRSFETEILERAETIFISSTALAPEEFADKKIVLVQNAVETSHFDPQSQKFGVPVDISEVPRPRIGFVGYIGRWVDIEILEYAAKKRADWNFVLIGPIHAPLGQLKGLPNVIILGTKPYSVLPGYVKSFDVCLLPFKEDELLEYIDPIKVYEYLAMGKPVVAFRYPRMECFDGLISLYSTKDEMVAAIENELAHGIDEEKAASRRMFALENSWEKRCEEIQNHLLALKVH